MHRTAYLLLLSTTLFWGGNAVAGKLAVGHVSPMLLTALRWGGALVILAALGWPRLRDDWAKVRRNLPLLTALGALGFTGFNIALYTALIHTTAINATATTGRLVTRVRDTALICTPISVRCCPPGVT